MRENNSIEELVDGYETHALLDIVGERDEGLYCHQ